MRLGILLDVQEGIDLQEWRRLVPLVEVLGFESLWRSDHLYSLFGHPERPGLECWTMLAWAAAADRRGRRAPAAARGGRARRRMERPGAASRAVSREAGGAGAPLRGGGARPEADHPLGDLAVRDRDERRGSRAAHREPRGLR